ncbi:MAG TPA: hypothetical protein VGW74_09845 [Propionibacteriaceae bacterium]|nr:hypothetical protein [Propionibacteriaceae bacterium]
MTATRVLAATLGTLTGLAVLAAVVASLRLGAAAILRAREAGL